MKLEKIRDLEIYFISFQINKVYDSNFNNNLNSTTLLQLYDAMLTIKVLIIKEIYSLNFNSCFY